MTIKRCSNCGKPFSTRIIKSSNFCSKECEYKFNKNLKDITDISVTQMDRDYKSKQKDEEKDHRLSRRRI